MTSQDFLPLPVILFPVGPIGCKDPGQNVHAYKNENISFNGEVCSFCNVT